LIRKIIERSGLNLNDVVNGLPLGETLLTPTRIYVKSLLELLKKIDVHAMAHITGGGITENLPRVLPKGLSATITLSAWQMPEIFAWLQQQGNINLNDMLVTFNCGIGMIVCVDAVDEANTLSMLQELGETAFSIGNIIQSTNEQRVIYN
jgi:phosphoribosylformylglycinamidine cyclo-ligase